MNENLTKNIKVESISLLELFCKRLTIPEYQRPYVWKLKDIKKLLRQIKIHNERPEEDKPMFYLGSIVLHEDENSNLNIIDGQQRITSLAIINFIKEKSDFGIKYNNLLSQQNIRCNYEQLIVERDLICVNTEQINVTVIITQNQDDAYNFFETLNTGGKRLSGIDIIKAHHLRSVESNKISSYAISWEKNQTYIEVVIKMVLKARKWNVLNFKDVPSRKSGLKEWKETIIDEFSAKTLKDNKDFSYSSLKMNGNTMEIRGNKYNVRQPISDGQNFINFLISFIDLYKQLFVFSGEYREDFYYIFNKDIINVIDGTIDLKPLYQLALLCYVSKFGFNRLTEISLWMFRFVYSKRVSVPNRVQEVTVINYNRDKQLIDRILTYQTEDEVLVWLKRQKYDFNQDNLNGVKGRFVNRVNAFFSLKYDSFFEFDSQLIQQIEKQAI